MKYVYVVYCGPEGFETHLDRIFSKEEEANSYCKYWNSVSTSYYWVERHEVEG